VYGAHAASDMTDAVGRCLSAFIQHCGHTCAVGDLVLTKASNAERRKLLDAAQSVAEASAAAFLAERNADAEAKAKAVAGKKASSSSSSSAASALSGGGGGGESTDAETRRGLGRLLMAGGEEGASACAALDGAMMSALARPSSDAVKACLPSGLLYPSWSPGPNSGGKHANGFALMVSSSSSSISSSNSSSDDKRHNTYEHNRRIPNASNSHVED